MFCEQTEQEREVQKGDVDLSVIVPFYNESGNLLELYAWIRSVLLNMNVSSELIFVDDGSTDGSAIELIKALKATLRW